MFSTQNLWLFFIASLLLNLTPGIDMIYVASRSAAQGVKAGIISACGIFIGCMVHTLAAILGLSFIIARSAFVFGIIKFLGAAYLIFLGIQSLTSKETSKEKRVPPRVNNAVLLRQGIITNILNPKVAIFFLSFLPQFIDPSSPYLKLQLFTLGAWFDIQGCLILVIVAWATGKTSGYFKKMVVTRNVQQKITGLVLIGLGIKLGLTTKK